MKIENQYGQIYFKDTTVRVKNDKQPVVAFENIKLTDLMTQKFRLDILETRDSSFKDTVFKSINGNVASAIYLEFSNIKLIGTRFSDDIINFEDNLSISGSTIFATFSNMFNIK